MLARKEVAIRVLTANKVKPSTSSEEEDDYLMMKIMDTQGVAESGTSENVGVPVSKLTYFEVCSISHLENEEYHFVGIDIGLLDHAPKDIIERSLLANLTN